MSENLIRGFTHITIPAEIWLRRDISIQSKALWAELRSLHDKEEGGCYASDEYLMEFLMLKRSRLHEVLKELKDAGLMIIINFNGRRTVRRAIVPDVEYYRQNEVSGKPDSRCPPENSVDSSCPENRTAEIRDPGFSPYIYNKGRDDDDDAREKTRSLDCGNVRNDIRTCQKQKPSGETLSCSIEEYFLYCVRMRKDWTTPEIEEAWNRFVSFQGAVVDWKKYLDQIILNKRQEVEKCNLQQKTEKPSKKQCKKELSKDNVQPSGATLLEPRLQARVEDPITDEQWNKFLTSLGKKEISL